MTAAPSSRQNPGRSPPPSSRRLAIRNAASPMNAPPQTWPPPAAGEALWSAPLPPHYVSNIGDRVLHIIAVEMKGG